MTFFKNVVIFLFLLLLLGFNSSEAQQLFINEHFEEYQPGDRICMVSPQHWFTWNNGAGTAEDPKVSNTMAFEGNNSLFITGSNNVLIDFGDKTTGRFETSFSLRLPVGKTGLYGMLQQFDGSDSHWGFRCYFDAGNLATIQADGTDKTFYFNHNQWLRIRNIIDLDNDYIEIYLNNNLIHEWQWSKGMDGNSGISMLDALNFFAWNSDGRSPEMYIDSLVFEELTPLEPPQNLTATVDFNKVILSWQEPSGGEPLGYRIYRNDVIVQNLISDLSYTDLELYPGNYGYRVNAVYVSGMSPNQPPLEVTIEGGTKRNFVLIEIATGTWCVYCPGASLAVEDFYANEQQVAVIKYHNQDDFANAASDYRNTFYNVPGFPTANFDGGNPVIGGNPTQSMYPEYLPKYTARDSKLALFTLALDVTKNSDMSYDVTVNASKIYPYAGSNLILHLALTESHIPEAWQTMSEVNNALREMIPDHLGTVITFSENDFFTTSHNIEINPQYQVQNVELVAFIQDNSTKEVLQVAKTILFSTGTGENAKLTKQLSVSPNPASDRITLHSSSPMDQYTILDINGRTISENVLMSGSTIETIDVSNLVDGLYFIKAKTDWRILVEKLLISHK